MTGEVTMTKPVRTEDTEDGRYDLVVRATDQGRDTQLYSDIRVVIEVRKKWSNEFLEGILKLVFQVGSIRNMKPKFSQPGYEIAIRENAPAGSEIMALVATDPDGDNSLLR